MKKFLILLFLLQLLDTNGQGTDSKSTQKIAAFLDFKANEKVADIGSGNLKRVIRIATNFPNTLFTLQDIDSTHCNLKGLSKQLRKNGNKMKLTNFSIVYGDTFTTHLEIGQYDHITMFSSLHEFSDKHKMLQDIKKSLKEAGFLYIYEDITLDAVTLFCPYKAQYFQSSQFYSLLNSEKIKIIDKLVILEDPDLQEIIFKCAFVD